MKQQNSPSICLNMIVKNESKIIKRCLESLRDVIDTWCIIDTGSTDGTQDIIKAFMEEHNKPGILHQRPWVNFGHNRNEGLQLASSWGDWIFLMDADMVLINRGFDKKVLNPSTDVYEITQDNNGTCYNNMRILSTKKTWKCIGVTHEYYDCDGGINVREYTDKLFFNDVSDGGSKSDKFTRDIALLTQGLIDDPTNVRYMFYLAQSYRDVRDYDKAIEWYKKRYESGGWDEEVWFSIYMMGWCMNARGDSFDVISPVCMQAWLLRPWRAEPVWLLGLKAKGDKMWYHAYQLFKIAATTAWPKYDVLFIAKSAYGAPALDEFAVAAYWTGHHDESEQACIKLLNDKTLPPQEVPRIKKNLWYTRKALGRYNEAALTNYITETIKTI